jgi:CHAT domain-containing protein
MSAAQPYCYRRRCALVLNPWGNQMNFKRVASMLLAVLTVSLAVSLSGCQTADGSNAASGSSSGGSSSGGY